MVSFFYNIALFLLALLALPKLLWQRFTKDKYQESLKQRLGIQLPPFTPVKNQEVIWIHAVSMGETKAIIPLFHMIRKSHPQAALVISTTTETGQQEAKRSMPEADAHFFLPLDFSWIIRRIVNRIQPSTLILCEGDFWYHLLKIAKEKGANIALVNGKVSERSCRRFQKIPFFTKRLFSYFDVLCVQSERYKERFLSMGISSDKLFATGNFKLDAPTKKMSDAEKQSFLGLLKIAPADRVIVLGSTHGKEEEMLLSALELVQKKIPGLKILLVPRHPERFNEVFDSLKAKDPSCSRLSQGISPDSAIILIDAMGKLSQCYQIADVAIVGGSYVPHVGGHNIFEPVQFDVPVLFGPHMWGQADLKEMILSAEAGNEVGLEDLPQTLLGILENPNTHKRYSDACQKLALSSQGATKRAFRHVFPGAEIPNFRE